MASEETPVKATQVKLVLLGEAAVGKSSLVLRFVSNDFNENNSPTIGAAFLTQKCRLENRIVKFEIWDTAGQERFHSLAPMYYRNAAAAVVVYDITKAASLDKAKAWVKELQRQASPNIVIALVGNKLDLVSEPSSETSATAEEDEESSKDPAEAVAEADNQENEDENEDSTPPPPTLNRVSKNNDNDLRQVSTAEASAYAQESKLLFFEASAKTGFNVGEIFTEIAKTIPIDTVTPKTPAATAGTRRNAAPSAGEGGVNLGEGNQGGKKAGCC